MLYFLWIHIASKRIGRVVRHYPSGITCFCMPWCRTDITKLPRTRIFCGFCIIVLLQPMYRLNSFDFNTTSVFLLERGLVYYSIHTCDTLLFYYNFPRLAVFRIFRVLLCPAFLLLNGIAFFGQLPLLFLVWFLSMVARKTIILNWLEGWSDVSHSQDSRRENTAASYFPVFLTNGFLGINVYGDVAINHITLVGKHFQHRVYPGGYGEWWCACTIVRPIVAILPHSSLALGRVITCVVMDLAVSRIR